MKKETAEAGLGNTELGNLVEQMDRFSISQMKQLWSGLSSSEKVQARKLAVSHVRKSGIAFTYQDLEMQSQFVDAHRDVSRYDDPVQLHSHAFAELLYCCSGEADYLLGSRRYSIRRGDVVFIPAGVSHRPIFRHPEEKAYYERIVIWINEEFLRKWSERMPEQNRSAHRGHLSDGFVLSLDSSRNVSLTGRFQEICREAEREEEGWQTVVCGTAVSLLALLLRAVTEEEQHAAAKDELLDQVLLFIDLHLSEKLRLEDTAARFHVSESTLSKLFRSHMNTSFYQYVTQCRLNAAKSLIARELPMSEVAEQVGFCDYTSFYRAFKKEYELSPGQYRALMNR